MSIRAFGFCFAVLLVLAGMSTAQPLSGANFYSTSCRNALTIIRNAVRAAVALEPRMGASLLRLHFHDCFVNGCDASVLLDDTPTFTGEKGAAPNVNSVRGFEVIDNIKAQLERACPRVVSCADLLTVASLEGVLALGGPGWPLFLGRKDSTTASLAAANSNIPSPALSLSGLIANFASKGFTQKEMIALSGAHTIGLARCVTFRTRLYNEANINPTYAAAVKLVCPQTGGDNNTFRLDFISPTTFDNAYYSDLQNQRGLLHSDQQLFNGGSADAQVNIYASNTAAFRTDFGNAMVKMGNLTNSNGQIRTNCRRVN